MTITILLVDDHALLRQGLRALLEAQADMSVVAEASNGRDALRLAVEHRPDVVLMDITMPDMNGIEALTLIRARCPDSRIAMLSMHSGAEFVHRTMDAGADAYLLKESVVDEVAVAVRTLHAGGRYLSSALGRLARDSSGDPRVGALQALSSRERQVLQLVVEGRSSAEIAAIVHLSPKTVETYRSRLMKKLDLADLPALVKFAVRHGLTPPS